MDQQAALNCRASRTMSSIGPKAPSTDRARTISRVQTPPPTLVSQPGKKSSARTALKSGPTTATTTGSPTLSPSVAGTVTNESLSLTDLVQQARAFYGSKDYVPAIRLLNRALALSPDEISLLDTRAACYEKLQKFDTALTLAKAMIQLHAQNPKGYLRAARVLRMQKRYATACRIYKAGIERSDKHSKDYSSLTLLLQDLELVMKNEARILDPFVLLPLELILNIFEMVPFEKRCVCTRVSKKWRSTLTGVSKLWADLDFTFPRPPPAQHSLYIPMEPDQRTNARVDNFTVLATAKHFSPKRLVLGTNQNITKGLFSGLVKLRRTRALEQLSLRQNYKVSDAELSLLWLSTPVLRRLDLSDVYGVTDDVAMALLERCRQLEELDLSECRVTQGVFIKSVAKGGPMSTLRKLAIGQVVQGYSRAGIEAIVGMFPNLTVLDFRSLRVDDVSALDALWRLSNVQQMYLESVGCLNEESVPRAFTLWMRGMQQLQCFQFRLCKGLSGSMAKMLVRPSLISPAYTSALIPPAVASDPQWQLLPELDLGLGGGGGGGGWASSLRMLDLSFSPFLEMDGWVDDSDAFPVLPNLHTLILNACGSVNEQDVCRLLANSGEKLCRFEFSRNEATSNQVLYSLRDYCPMIQYVNVGWSRKVTGMGVMALVNCRGQELEYLCLDGCQNVGADAVDRARYVLGQAHRVSFVFARK